MYSAWSVMDTQSSGRSCLKCTPLSMTTSPPVATLKRSSGVSVVPNIPASKEKRGVDVGNAPEDPSREGLARIRGILPASDDGGRCDRDWRPSRFLRRGRFRIRRCRCVLTRAAGHQREADGRETGERRVGQSSVSFHGYFSFQWKASENAGPYWVTACCHIDTGNVPTSGNVAVSELSLRDSVRTGCRGTESGRSASAKDARPW